MFEGFSTAVGMAKAVSSISEAQSVKFGTGKLRKKFDELTFLLQKGMPRYLSANYAKFETIKNLLSRNDPIPIDSCFVEADISFLETAITATKFLEQVKRQELKCVVTGLAGSGKSVFLKHAFRASIEKGFSYFPLFLELRELNGQKPSDGMLVRKLFDTIAKTSNELSLSQFEFGLKNGSFWLIFDGFDEITGQLQDQVATEICDISRSFHKCPMIVSSRPAERFAGWEGFHECRLQPFSLEQVKEYLRKLRFEAEKREEFISALESGEYERNRSFLSNPLLAAMMLLTYDSFGEIPEKRHMFYRKCFDVLTREHDSLKGSYTRELKTGFSVDEIEQVFMLFCALSYGDRISKFDREKMVSYVSQAMAGSNLSAANDAVIGDFCEAVSIMELVGGEYEFAHRSFQEYFYARFVVKDRTISLIDKIGWLIEFFGYDDTVEMIRDMDQSYFEDEYLLPEARRLFKLIKDVEPRKRPSLILNKFFGEARAFSRTGDDGDAGISYTLKSMANHYIYTACFRHLHVNSNPEVSIASIDDTDASKKAEAFLEKHPKGLKVHHANNSRLIEFGIDKRADDIKRTIKLAILSLEERQTQRSTSIGNRLRNSLGIT